MLYLPRGVWAWFQNLSVKKNATLGRLLIEVCCNWAYENGFNCDHQFIKFDRVEQGTTGLRVRWEKCITCGMKRNYRLNVPGAKDAAPWVYGLVGGAEPG